MGLHSVRAVTSRSSEKAGTKTFMSKTRGWAEVMVDTS
jgi:hypothetical protein